jgi:tRNA (cmo5U34)-methyltransferase
MSNPESESSYDLTKKFSFDSIEGFDEHISLHIRDYDRLGATVLAIADSFIIGGKRVYDIGCSTGKLITALDTKYADRRAEYVGIDVNHNFAKDFEDTDTVKFNKADVTRGYSFSEASLILSLFTLQFIDPKDRLRVLDSISESLDIGYGFIVAEKVMHEFNEGEIEDWDEIEEINEDDLDDFEEEDEDEFSNEEDDFEDEGGWDDNF